jgi:hypothetical protein
MGSGHVTSGGNLEQLGDEAALSPDVASTDGPNWPLPDHRHCLKACQRSGCPEAAEAEPRAGQPFDAPVVLLNSLNRVHFENRGYVGSQSGNAAVHGASGPDCQTTVSKLDAV